MDLVLVSITAVSLMLAIAMGLIVLKLLRDERQRSDARVALLAAATASQASRLRNLDAVPAADVEAAPVTPSRQVAIGELFAAQEPESPQLRRALAAAAVAVILTVTGFALTRGGGSPAEQGPVAPAPSTPLELLALNHEQQDRLLTISGIVRNPQHGASRSQVAATAFLFAADGTHVASGRAGLDYATLAPGDESGFAISVPVTGPVSRYRVAFRAPDGSIVAHVDRRGDGQSAANAGSAGSRSWDR